jgi:hypothetical protein
LTGDDGRMRGALSGRSLRRPNNSESFEVVRYAANRKFVFDDAVVRTKKR